MIVTEILTKLESLGNEKVRAHNVKFGAGENQFGVKMGDIRNMAKAIKTNHKLAMELWQTGNVEARLLAILIIEPKRLTPDELDAMVRSESFSQVADWLSNYVIKEYPGKEDLRLQWMQITDPMAARAGWSLTAGRVARNPQGLDIEALLKRIEAEMPTAPPETQWTMNSTLANIGIHHPAYRERALAIGERLGIYRDYPVSKGCTSPFAPIWINEMVKRQG
ncbi:DNA alkylation repair protein [Mucilaginibacter sp. JRF]|uniref:DNA alkylation repair protein n=1 Tax=Mucilaginibacter sp. JRF TaxID=2780088 RepID=UPI00187FBCD7|nr:DNA alkylation repair protein [Mucilaginibacter sp. JRF]MBE9584873.1 DNA alkylation repair protein [Mucilaginibacter sp. JRF]